MPRIPDETAFGARPTPRIRRRVQRDNSGVIVAESLARAGDELGQQAAINQQKEDRFAYQKAKSSLLHADIEARRELEDIEDYTTWEEKYQERMAKSQSEAAKNIRSDRDRAIFEMEARLDIERSTESVRRLARGREVDDGQATLADTLERNRSAALEANDPALRQEFIESAKQMILAAQENGYITAVQAEKMDSAWTRDTAEGLLTMMPAEERVKVLTNPKGTIAEALPPDQRARLRDQALKENKVTRNRAASQSESDRIMDAHPNNRGEALAAARKITDPDVRSMTVDNVNQRFNEIAAIERETDQRRFGDAATKIEAGMLASEIPARDWVKFTVSQRRALEARSRQLRSGEQPVHDDEKYYEWSQLSIEQQAQANLLEWRPYFDDAHYNRAVERQRAILDAKEGGKDSKTSLTSVRSYDQLLNDELMKSGLFTKKPTKGDAAVRWARIESGIAERIERRSESLGRKLTPTEMREEVDQALMERYFVDEFGRDPERLALVLTEEQKRDAYVPYDDIPDRQRRRLENYARSLGIRAGEEEIGKAYAAGRLGLGDERIEEALRGR